MRCFAMFGHAFWPFHFPIRSSERFRARGDHAADGFWEAFEEEVERTARGAAMVAVDIPPHPRPVVVTQGVAGGRDWWSLG